MYGVPGEANSRYPRGLSKQLPAHTGTLSKTFVAIGPSCNAVHSDPVGGCSQLWYDWKVVFVFHMSEWPTLVRGMRNDGMDIQGLMKAESLRWVLLGPGSTIMLPPQMVHFVITLSDSVLVTWCRTPFVHNQLLSLLYHAAGQVPDETWAALTSADYVKLFRYLCTRGEQQLKAVLSDRAGKAKLRWLLSCWANCRWLLRLGWSTAVSNTGILFPETAPRLTKKETLAIKTAIQQLQEHMVFAEAMQYGEFVCSI